MPLDLLLPQALQATCPADKPLGAVSLVVLDEPQEMYNIVTSICVDQDNSGPEVNYPQIGDQRQSERRLIYWQCVYTFCSTSLSVNGDKRHFVFTNDDKDVIAKGLDIKQALAEAGVSIVYRPFDVCDPHPFSKSYRNAFYKLENNRRASRNVGSISSAGLRLRLDEEKRESLTG